MQIPSVARDERGVTFVELLVYVVGFGLIATSMIMLLFWKQTVERQMPTADEMEFELFQYELAPLLRWIERPVAYRNGLYWKKDGRSYDVRLVNGTVRLQKDGSGYVPLLTNVDSIQWEVVSSTDLHCTVFRSNGKREEASLVYAIAPK